MPFAGLAPIVALSAIAIFCDADLDRARWIAVGFVGIAGLAALPFAWRMSRDIQTDVTALMEVMQHEETPVAHANGPAV
jgi:hypothetical protein